MANSTQSENNDSNGNCTSNVPVFNELNNLRNEYSKYISFDISKEKSVFDCSIEDLLIKLDEYCSLVDIIRSDTNLCLGKTLPAIHARSLKMEATFHKIDQLEAFVGMVRDQVSVLEKQMDVAEEQMGSVNTIKKIFTSIPLPSFLSKRNPQPAVAAAPKAVHRFSPPLIYNTNDYISYEHLSENQSQDGANSPRSEGIIPSSSSDESPVRVESPENEIPLRVESPENDSEPKVQ